MDRPVRMVLQGWFKTPSSRKSCMTCFTTVYQTLSLITAGQFQKRERSPEDSKLLKIWWEINGKKGDYFFPHTRSDYKRVNSAIKSLLRWYSQHCFWLDVADTGYCLVEVSMGSTVWSWGYLRVGGTQAEKDTHLVISTSSGHKQFGFSCLTIIYFSISKWQCMYVHDFSTSEQKPKPEKPA